MVAVAFKTPDEVKDYSVDYTNALEEGEFIAGSSWTTSDPSLGVNNPFPSINQEGTITTVWLSAGGTLNGQTRVYKVTNEVTTNQNRVFEWSFLCKVSTYNQL